LFWWRLMRPRRFSPRTSKTMQTWVPLGPLWRKWSRKDMTWDRPEWVCEGDGEGLGLAAVGGTGGVVDVMRRWRSLISSRAVSVYRGADLTTLRATCLSNLEDV
jgi:hypothetical protein